MLFFQITPFFTGALGRGSPIRQHQQVPGIRARSPQAARLRAARHSTGRSRRHRPGTAAH